MTILKDFSILWSLLHTLFLFLLLFESRYPKKKTLILSCATMVPLIVVNTVIFIIVGPERYTTLLLFTCSLPSLFFFWFLAKHRDGRFFFTFCMVDSLILEIIYITSIVDFYLGNTCIFMFAARIICIPLLELLIYKKLRPIYLSVQQSVNKGWYVFAAISAIFYVAMSLSVGHPTLITSRPEYLPAFIMYLVLMPLIYIHIFNTLRHQQNTFEMAEKEKILQLQVANMRARIEEFSASTVKLQEERHNYRHKLNVISTLAEKGQTEKIIEIVREYTEMIPEKTVRSYSNYPVLDAVLTSYLEWAKRKGIRVTTKLAFPETLPVNETELATALANAIENAIQACEKIETPKRYLELKSITEPCFMLQIRNSFDGVVDFSEEGIPLSGKNGHGFGTRSIVTFCEKNDAFYEFLAEDKEFTLRLVFT